MRQKKLIIRLQGTNWMKLQKRNESPPDNVLTCYTKTCSSLNNEVPQDFVTISK